jgi:O-antigen/teichoic acid export membrane protein
MLRLRHILSTSAASIVGGGLGLVLAFAVARLLTPAENGHYAQFSVVMNLVFIGLNFGLGTASTYYLASGRLTLASIVRLNLRFTVVVAGSIGAVAALLLATRLGEAAARGAGMPLPILCIGLVAGALLLAVIHVAAILFGAHRYDRANLVNVMRSGAALPLVVAAAALTGSSVPVATAHAATLALVLMAALAMLPRAPQSSTAGAAGGAGVRELLRFGGQAYLSNLLHFAAMRGLLIVLSATTDAEQVGYFNLALLILEALLLLPSAIGQLVFPQSSSAAFDRKLVESVLRLNLALGVMMALAALALARPVVRLLLGEPYDAVGSAMLHLAPAVALMTVPRILSQLLTGQGHPEYPLLAAVLSTAGAAGLAWAWVPTHGIAGAAWVCNVVALITAAVTILGYMRTQRTSISELLRPRRSDLGLLARLRRPTDGRG